MDARKRKNTDSEAAATAKRLYRDVRGSLRPLEQRRTRQPVHELETQATIDERKDVSESAIPIKKEPESYETIKREENDEDCIFLSKSNRREISPESNYSETQRQLDVAPPVDGVRYCQDCGRLYSKPGNLRSHRIKKHFHGTIYKCHGCGGLHNSHSHRCQASDLVSVPVPKQCPYCSKFLVPTHKDYENHILEKHMLQTADELNECRSHQMDARQSHEANMDEEAMVKEGNMNRMEKCAGGRQASTSDSKTVSKRDTAAASVFEPFRHHPSSAVDDDEDDCYEITISNKTTSNHIWTSAKPKLEAPLRAVDIRVDRCVERDTAFEVEYVCTAPSTKVKIAGHLVEEFKVRMDVIIVENEGTVRVESIHRYENTSEHDGIKYMNAIHRVEKPEISRLVAYRLCITLLAIVPGDLIEPSQIIARLSSKDINPPYLDLKSTNLCMKLHNTLRENDRDEIKAYIDEVCRKNWCFLDTFDYISGKKLIYLGFQNRKQAVLAIMGLASSSMHIRYKRVGFQLEWNRLTRKVNGW